MKATLVLLPGDGVGGEVVAEARAVLEAIASRFGHQFVFEPHLIGGCAIDAEGEPLSEKTLSACRNADAILLGAVGSPQWDNPEATIRPEQGLLALRQHLGLFANLRPIRVHPSLSTISPLKPERLANVDIMVVRELTGGLYFGQPRGREQLGNRIRAVDTLTYTDEEIRRVVRIAFQLATKRRGLVTSVDKANVLESSRLWRQVAIEVSAEFPHVRLEHQLVDSAAMRLISAPQSFDVLVTENMFGDILTDEASVLAGSLGLLPSASVGEGRLGVYEPIHGSAPDIAGKGVANPIGTILSAALLLRYSLGLEVEAQIIEKAVDSAIAMGAKTAELGGTLSTRAMGDAVQEQIYAISQSL